LRAGGEHFCLLEIRDASAYAARESLHQRHAEGLRALTFSDSLTGIANRRQFDMTLDREVRRAQRNGHQLALLLLDIDSFKTYNDHFGHPQGDDCLRNVAQAIDQMARRSGDLVARYGGEEFAVILPESTIDQALHFGEALRMKVRRMQLPHAPAAARDIVTVSIGLALYEPGSRGKLSELIEAADSALYRAKHAGRDRVCLADRTSSNAGA
jgi:diguanylate cyclase (GGDEF)-like protein